MSSRHLFTGLAGLLLCIAAVSLANGSGSSNVGQPDPTSLVTNTLRAEPVTPIVTAVADGVVSVQVISDQSIRTVDHTDGVAVFEVHASEDATGARTPVAMALVIDTSGSMAGEKIEQARAAAIHLVEALESGDIVSVISYGRRADLVVESQELGRNRRDVTRAINSLTPSGNTCMSCGMTMGYQQLAEAPDGFARRVVVLSDGRANQGDSTSHGLSRLSGASSEVGIVTSTVGLGEDYDETIMSAVATSGSGSYYFLPDATRMASIFERELDALSTTVATDVVVRISAPRNMRLDATHIPGVEQSGNEIVLSIRQLSAGETRRFMVPVTYAADASGEITASLEYESTAGAGGSASASLMVSLTDDINQAKASQDTSVVAEWEMSHALQEAEVAMRQMRDGDMAGASANLDGLIDRLEEQSAELGDADLEEEAENMRALRSRIAAPGFSGSGAEGRGLYLQNSARSAEAAAGVPRAEMYHDSTVY